MLLPLFVAAAASFALMSVATTYLRFLLAIAIGGMAIGASNPSTNAITAANIPVRARGSVIGIKQSGVFLGSITAGALLAPLAGQYGWRTVFIAVGALMLTAVPLSFMAIPASETSRARRAHLASEQRNDVPLLWLSTLAFFFGAGTACLTVYAALFAHDELGMHANRAAQLVTVLGVSGVVGRLLWAELTNRSGHRFLVLTTISVIAAVGQGAVVTSAAISSEVALWIGVAAVGASAGAFNAVAMVIVVRGWTGQPAGRASGAVQAGFQAGLMVSPLVFGLLVDMSDGYAAGWLYAFVVFVAGCLLALYGHHRARSSAGTHTRARTDDGSDEQ